MAYDRATGAPSADRRQIASPARHRPQTDLIRGHHRHADRRLDPPDQFFTALNSVARTRRRRRQYNRIHIGIRQLPAFAFDIPSHTRAGGRPDRAQRQPNNVQHDLRRQHAVELGFLRRVRRRKQQADPSPRIARWHGPISPHRNRPKRAELCQTGLSIPTGSVSMYRR